MEEKVRETISQLNVQLGEMPYKLDVVNPKEIKLLEKNARYMSHEMFQNLVNNVKRDGGLTSLPLCYREPDGRLLVLSGNHRVQAAVHAGVPKIIVLVIEKSLSKQEQVAIQLSHNAIEGKDDPVTLKELWDEIKEIDLKCYAGLDSELLKELDKMQFLSISDTRPETKQMLLLFMPEEIDEIKSLMNDIDLLFSAEEHFLLSKKHYDHVFKLLVEVKEKFEIVNNPTAFMKIIEMARTYMDSLSPVQPS